MSADAIFRATQALRTRLQQALADAGDPGSVFIGPLDDPDAQGAALILFLYRIMPNASLRNREHRVLSDSPPPPVLIFTNSLPLDLHYLLTAYGADQFHAEILLGYGMQLLHETPVLTRNAIRRSLAGPSQVNPGGGLPDALRNLFTSQLSEQVEMIKI